MGGEQSILNLEETFKKNLDFFRKEFPHIASLFENYTPEAELYLDNTVGFNIKKNGQFLYPSDGRAVSYEQLLNWLQEPLHLVFPAVYQKGNTKDIHIRYINKLVDLRKKILKTEKLAVGEKLPLLIVVGVGLGLHLDFLAEAFQIENLIILEPEKDFFYISLHIIDWEKILKNINTVQFFIGEDAKDIKLLLKYFDYITYFLATTGFIFIHYTTPETENLLKKLSVEISEKISGLGFFDDEIISLKHTLINIKNRIPLFNIGLEKGKPRSLPKAAAVVGSGPSLDKLLPYLKRYRDKLFIISCGTALGILEKNGIVPDLHVNIERNKAPYDVVIQTTSEEYREKVDFLGANNNWPEFFKAFGRNAYYLKANDTGSLLFKDYEKLYYVNPTVTNTGLSIAGYLGFEKVFLFGVDLAFPEEKQHAKGSYYDTLPNFRYESHLEVEGNFGGTLKTSRVFYIGIQRMNEAIEFFQEVRPFEVYNPNYGAKIEKAKTVNEKELEGLLKNLPTANLEEFKKEYWQKYIEVPDIQQFNFPQIKMQLMTGIFQIRTAIEEKFNKAQTFEEYRFLIESIYYLLLRLKDISLFYYLMIGTMTQFLSHMYVGIFVDAPVEVKLKFLEEAKKLLIEMLKEMEQEILNLYSYFPA